MESAHESNTIMKNIRFVYFDVGDVLVSNVIGHKRLAEHVNRPREHVTAFFDANWERACRGTISSSDYLSLLKTNFQFDCEEREFGHFYTKFLASIVPMHAFTEKLATRLPVGILSNAEFGSIEAALQVGVIPNVSWKTKIISAHHKTVKPEQKIFEIAQREAHVPHESIFLIDDRISNIEMAQKLGWRCFHFDPKKPHQSVQRLTKFFAL